MAFTLPTCDQCGVVDHVLVDGYSFGDRLLERVLFEVRAVRGRPQVTVTAEAAAYFEGLNTTHWLRAARTYVRTADLFICPHCHSDVEAVAPPSTPPRVAVPIRKASVLGRPTGSLTPTQENLVTKNNTLAKLLGLC